MIVCDCKEVEAGSADVNVAYPRQARTIGHQRAEGRRQRGSGGHSGDVHGATTSLGPQQLASYGQPMHSDSNARGHSNGHASWHGSCSFSHWRRGRTVERSPVSSPSSGVAEKPHGQWTTTHMRGPRTGRGSLSAYVYLALGCGPCYACQCVAVATKRHTLSHGWQAVDSRQRVQQPRCAAACRALSVCRRRHGESKWQRVVRTVDVCAGRLWRVRDSPHLHGLGVHRSICPAGSGQAMKLDASHIHIHTLSHSVSSAALTNIHTCTTFSSISSC